MSSLEMMMANLGESPMAPDKERGRVAAWKRYLEPRNLP